MQESHNRSDSNPANGGTQIRRAIRADSAAYTTTAGANQAYAGRSDVWHLADVADPLALSAAERSSLITATTQQAPVFEEDILRTRRGFNAAMQWKPHDGLEFYAETNYNYYLYHQQYRFLFANDTRTVQGLTTSAYELTEALANRNSNGGANEVLAGQRINSYDLSLEWYFNEGGYLSAGVFDKEIGSLVASPNVKRCLTFRSTPQPAERLQQRPILHYTNGQCRGRLRARC